MLENKHPIHGKQDVRRLEVKVNKMVSGVIETVVGNIGNVFGNTLEIVIVS